MIAYADVEKLLATRSEDPPVLSLYLEVPLDLRALHGLPARAGELVNSAAGGPCGPGGPHAGRVLTEASQAVRRILEDSARGWLGHCVAIFICGPAGLAEAIPLPAGLGEQAVFGPRPHVRPLLVALHRQPAYRVVVVDRRHAWLFAVAGDRIDAVTQPAAAGVRSPRYGGWYGLESYRVNERIAELTHHHLPRHRRRPRSGHPPRAGAARRSAATPTPSRSSSPCSRLTCVTASLAASWRTPPP